MGEVFAAFRDDPELRVAMLQTAGEKFFCAGFDLKAAAAGDAVDGDYGVGGFGGLQELPGPQQAGDRCRARHGGGRRVRDRPVLRPHLRHRGRAVRAPRDQRRHPRRRRDHQAAQADAVPRRDGAPAHRTLDGRRGGAPLGPGQRGAPRPRRADGAGLGGRPAAGVRAAAGLRRDQGGRPRSRGRAVPGGPRPGHRPQAARPSTRSTAPRTTSRASAPSPRSARPCGRAADRGLRSPSTAR